MTRAASSPTRPYGLLACAAAVAAYLVWFLADYDNWFVHLHQFKDHLSYLVYGPPAFERYDLFRPFTKIDLVEDRPRYLNYLIALVDYRLRLLAYDWLVLFPPLSIAWPLTLGVAPYLLYRLSCNLGMSVRAAALTVLIYATSTGFLSGFTMVWQPGKSLTNVALIAGMYLMSHIARHARPGQLFAETAGRPKTLLLLTMGISPFLDEGPVFVFLLLPILFRELFLGPADARPNVRRLLRNACVFLLPLVAFLGVVLTVYPVVTQREFGYRFDYLGTLLARRPEQQRVGKTLLGSSGGGFGFRSVGENVLTGLGVSFVPVQVSPFLPRDYREAAPSRQTHNAWQVGLLATVSLGALALMSGAPAARKRYWGRLCGVALAYVLFWSALLGRHVVYFTGYYYGNALGIFLALAVGLCVDELASRGRPWLWVSWGMAGLLMANQLNNFAAINRSNIRFHNEVWTKAAFGRRVPIADETPTTRAELSAIHAAWKAGSLDAYLARHRVSAGAVFLVVELRHLDSVR